MQKKETRKRISEVIKRALFDKKMRQVELAKRLDVSKNVVTHWVSGRNIPPGDKLVELATILDIKDELFPESKGKKEINIADVYKLIAELSGNQKVLAAKQDVLVNFAKKQSPAVLDEIQQAVLKVTS